MKKVAFIILLFVTHFIFEDYMFAGQKVSVPVAFDLFTIKHVTPKGRIQDKSYNPDLKVIDEIIGYGPDSIPILIRQIKDDREVGVGIIDYWGTVHVGDLAFIILVDLFTDQTWTKSTIQGASWNELLEVPRNSSTTSALQFSKYIEKHDRAGLTQKWSAIWTKYHKQIRWDEDKRCYILDKLGKRPFK